MITDTSKKIVSFIKKNRTVKPRDLVDYLGLSRQAIFRQLKKLINQEILVKNGTSPNVFYSLKENLLISQKSSLDMRLNLYLDSKIINKMKKNMKIRDFSDINDYIKYLITLDK